MPLLVVSAFGCIGRGKVPFGNATNVSSDGCYTIKSVLSTPSLPLSRSFGKRIQSIFLKVDTSGQT